jgi:K+-transporting ATPase A subunit
VLEIFAQKGKKKLALFFYDEMARGIFYVFLALCVVGTLRLALAIQTRIRHRQPDNQLKGRLVFESLEL